MPSSEAQTEMLRIARQALRGQPAILGLIPLGGDAVPFASRLATAITQLTGRSVAIVHGESEDQTPSSARHFPEPIGPDPFETASWRVEAAREAKRSFAHVLVDFSDLPLDASTLAAADALVVLARAGLTNEDELRTLSALIPSERLRGVVLMG